MALPSRPIGVLDRTYARNHHVSFSVLYDGVKVMDDANRIISRSKGFVEGPQYNWQAFLGSQVAYAFTALNHPVIPTKGIALASTAAYTGNLQRPDRSIGRFTTDLDVYGPLIKNFSLALRSGAATINGNPDFYQLNNLGGTNSVRGYQRYRFYGKTTFYNQNELRWIPQLKTKYYDGPVGLFVLFDQGRVWQPGEKSDKMHYSYGGGFIITPLNKVAITTAFAKSPEEGRFHISLRKLF